ncbi:AI-2E family transporter [Tersicoccus phoenicis]|uniref:AI-2E family transporter n=1 Tax=Tersicoccus phoenicis TaxID=554083 RepID=UPI001F22604E|nr:AI-2E family transporter [Tersicoccus phoenicis]
MAFRLFSKRPELHQDQHQDQHRDQPPRTEEDMVTAADGVREPTGSSAPGNVRPPSENAPEANRGRLGMLLTDALGTAGLRSVQVIAVLALVAVGIWALLQVTVVVLPVLIALILSSAMWPLVRRLRRVVPAILAAWVVFLGTFVVLGGVIAALYFAVRAQWSSLVDQAATGVRQLQDVYTNLPVQFSQQDIDGAVQGVTDFFTSAQFGASALTGLSAAGNFFTGLALLLVVLFFFLKDGDRIWDFVLSWVKPARQPKWRQSGTRAVDTFGGYIRGTAIIAAVDAVGIGLALWVLGVPLALPLAVIVFIGAFVPLVGATAAGVLATLVALVANGPLVALGALAAVIIVNQLEGDFLQPVVMGQTLSLHPLVILIALAVGTVLGGLAGAVLSVPLTAVAWKVIKVWTGRDEQPTSPEETGRAA